MLEGSASLVYFLFTFSDLISSEMREMEQNSCCCVFGQCHSLPASPNQAHVINVRFALTPSLVMNIMGRI